MAKLSKLILQKSSDASRNALNVAILSRERSPIATLSISERTREISLFISGKGDGFEIDLEALLEKVEEAKAMLIKWADEVAGSEN